MHTIVHKNPGTHGIVILAARAFHFKAGRAEVEHLAGHEQAAILARGHTIEQSVDIEPKPEARPKRKPKPPPVDISDPTVQVTEKAPPEIG